MTTDAAGGATQNPAGGSGAAGAGDGAAAAATGAAGAGEQTWLTGLDPELQKSPSAKKFKGKDWNEVGPQIFKSYHNLERWQVPGDDAKPEDIAAFNRRRGIPEKIEEYAGTIKPEIPEGVPWTPELQTQFATFAHSEGLTSKQATNLINFWAKLAGQGIDIQTSQSGETLRKSHEGLKAKWGGNYERTVGLVHRTIEEYGNPAFNEMLDTVVVKGENGEEMKLGNHPAMLEFIARHGEGRLEAGFIQGNTLLTTQSGAQADLAKILDDPTHPYWKGDKAALKRVQELLAVTEAPKTPR